MGIRVSVLVGLGVSALFFVIQWALGGLPTPWNLVASAAVGFVAIGAAVVIKRDPATSQKAGMSIMTDITGEKTVKGKIEGLKTAEAPEKVMTGIKATDDIELEIKNSDFHVKG